EVWLSGEGAKKVGVGWWGKEKVGERIWECGGGRGRGDGGRGRRVGSDVCGGRGGCWEGGGREGVGIGGGGGASWILSGGTPYSPTSSRRIIWECAIISLAVA
ncbi:hypothetical protein COI32_11090, partial [Neisseria meningitidis]